MDADNEGVYTVLSPWAEVDPVSLRGLTVERPGDLTGKTIGLFHMWKRSSKSILAALERQLRVKYLSAF